MDLKKYIKDNYKNQYVFAKEIGVKQSNVSYWCNTEWKRLTYKTRERICKLLGVEVC